ncbi:hypothetical protein AUEXF2481DRAFT_140829 [Aureobasidium subglaciale EXF-2481]|uniref:Uncharacterized protein n=1 Tax=Aureobasidium subglaciale (strain EXF-2481) TaxID=1043005 RepID=A0A074YRZ2_AURSE|nr:uncharacterized protein AUEXF2481DRAFT_140829 [Aureobasidium subglaciale EXF-2481]KER00519.1 hypothetical protein AUEXF2481DRAFT_140829 [Aureobasidium subglaciale EXF-2481]
MPSIRSLLVAGLQVTGLALADFAEYQVNTPDVGGFKQLLGHLPEESIHAALSGHLGGKYQAGVFEADHRAMEHIHKDNPSLASRLIEIAKHDVAVRAELRKRQDNSADNTTVIAVPSTTSSEAASSTSTDAVIVTDASTTSVSLTTETSAPSSTIESSVAPSSTTGVPSSLQLLQPVRSLLLLRPLRLRLRLASLSRSSCQALTAREAPCSKPLRLSSSLHLSVSSRLTPLQTPEVLP